MEVRSSRSFLPIFPIILFVLCLLGPFLLFLTSFIPPLECYAESNYFTYDSTLYGPYVKEDKITFTYGRHYNGSSTLSKVSDRIRCYSSAYSSSSPFYTSSLNSSHSITNGDYFTKTITIPNSKSYLPYGIRVLLGVYNATSKSFIDSREFYIYPKKNDVINPLNYRVNPYVITNTVFTLNGNVNESFLFNNVSDFVEVDSYNRIRFDFVSFIYSFSNEIKYGNCYLSFIDINNLYPNLANSNNVVNIPFTLGISGDNISPAFPNLYYDPLTLEMTSSGVSSKYLYVPRGKASLLEGYTFSLVYNAVGVNETSFTINLEASLDSYYLGKCDSEADYCIIGGIRS